MACSCCLLRDEQLYRTGRGRGRVADVPIASTAHCSSALLTSGILVQEEQAGNIDSELATVISSIALACKQISSLVTRSGISNLTGAAGGANFSVCHLGLSICCPWWLVAPVYGTLPAPWSILGRGCCLGGQCLADAMTISPGSA